MAPLLVQRHVLAGGENVVAVAVVRQADAGTAAVAFRLDANGASRLAEASQPGAVIAILLDNEIIAAPTIRARIADGAVLLSGGLTLPQAKELALLLRAGFMSAPLAIIERQIVEPKSR